MEIKTFTPEDSHIKALIYGPSGSGKTYFAGTAKDSIFASAEAGMLALQGKKQQYVDVKSYQDLGDLYKYLSKGKHKFKTVVIDSITEINEVIKAEIEERTGRKMQLQDWGEVATKLGMLFRLFRDLPMNVIFIAQEKYMQDEDKIKKIVPSLNGAAATKIAYYMDIVAYSGVEKDGEDSEYWIRTSPEKKLLTKDRSGLVGDHANPNFSTWEKAIKKMKTGKEKVKEVQIDETPEEKVAKNLDKKPTKSSHLKDLQMELKERGAKNKEEALKLLNKLTGKKYETIMLSANDAADALALVLLSTK